MHSHHLPPEDSLCRPVEFSRALGRERLPTPSSPLPWFFVLILLLIGIFATQRKEEPWQPKILQEGSGTARDYDQLLLEERIQQEERKKEEARERLPMENGASITLEPPPPGHVRVAAIQYHSDFNHPERNRQELAALIRRAADLGAKIITLPEAAVCGYADRETETFWACMDHPETQKELAKPEEEQLNLEDVTVVAETAEGPTIRFFSELTQELGIYLLVTYIEWSKDPKTNQKSFFSAATLLDPQGQSILHTRKRILRPILDTFWATPGDLPVRIASTPWGRIAIALSLDYRHVLSSLPHQGADLLLHAAAFSSARREIRNFVAWLEGPYREEIGKAKMATVLANWASLFPTDWEGHGFSRILDREGRLIAGRGNQPGNCLVIGDLPLP